METHKLKKENNKANYTAKETNTPPIVGDSLTTPILKPTKQHIELEIHVSDLISQDQTHPPSVVRENWRLISLYLTSIQLILSI